MALLVAVEAIEHLFTLLGLSASTWPECQPFLVDWKYWPVTGNWYTQATVTAYSVVSVR